MLELGGEGCQGGWRVLELRSKPRIGPGRHTRAISGLIYNPGHTLQLHHNALHCLLTFPSRLIFMLNTRRNSSTGFPPREVQSLEDNTKQYGWAVHCAQKYKRIMTTTTTTMRRRGTGIGSRLIYLCSTLAGSSLESPQVRLLAWTCQLCR